ncbi:MAG TPA: glycosyltransferase [Chitinophagales bacterium]|nr:glycosyltransferase [Chitinophagales bacterium]
MKLMMVLSRVPFPLDKGDKLRAYHMLRYLSKYNEVYLFCISEEPIAFDVKEHLLEYCKEIHVFPISRYASLLKCGLATGSAKPFQTAYFYDAGIHRQIDEHAKRIKPNCAFFQLVRTTEYARNIEGATRVIDYMDAFSTGYARMAARSGIFQKLLFNNESQRLKKYEADVFAWFDKHVIISEQDKELINHPDREKIEVIHNGVDAEYFVPSSNTKKFNLLFHGNMNYLPNVDCASYVADEILPELHKRGTAATFLISGGSPNNEILSLAGRRGITVTGWLDDVRSSYAVSEIFIAPLQMGTGIQNKLLEAMAMGIPCVVSSLAAKALNLQHGHHALIGDTTKDYCDHIETLWNNPELNSQLVKNALAYTRENFRWQDKVEKLQQFISN